MEKLITQLIESYVLEYGQKNAIFCQWKKPIVKFASTADEEFKKLKVSVSKDHLMPKDLIENSKTVITYFLPFDEKIAISNINGKKSSKEWSIAYIETNQLISDLNNYLKKYLEKMGYRSNTIPATHNFNEKTLKSQWSHRHVAEISGLGTFGLNNMLITEAGCCGRIGSIVSTIELTPSKKVNEENCLYKLDGSCGICVDRCSFEALTHTGFDRKRCYEICLINDAYHSDLGVTDVCGKCCVKVPCSFYNPRKV
ncbi:MAG TPA: epoxyqueuosine reductase [Clostridia bacterium]|nr:epoxyqueuosine reductase [Clostridia bacterium]